MHNPPSSSQIIVNLESELWGYGLPAPINRTQDRSTNTQIL